MLAQFYLLNIVNSCFSRFLLCVCYFTVQKAITIKTDIRGVFRLKHAGVTKIRLQLVVQPGVPTVVQTNGVKAWKA